MAFDLSEVTKYADFGRAVLDLAKEHGVLPKAKTRVRVINKVVVKRRRRTRAEIEAEARAIESGGLPGVSK